jgi:hypothetical protein
MRQYELDKKIRVIRDINKYDITVKHNILYFITKGEEKVIKDKYYFVDMVKK